MWITVIAVIIAVVSVVLLVKYRMQIRSFKKQLDYISEHDTNKLVTQELDFKEITEFTESLNRLIRTNKELNREYRTKEKNLKELVTNLSHDIRTPLTALDGYFQLLVETESEEERRRYSQIIEGRIQSLSEILEQLFTYMKVQNETYDLPLEEVNINRLIYNAMFSFYDNFMRKGIEPKVEIPEEPYYININQNAFMRIMQNIIKNVLEHGANEFELTVIENEEGATILCKNEYSSEELIQMEQLFERFYKADEARKHSSTGLGLAIVKSLVVRMGGTIRAYKCEKGRWNQLCIEVVFPR